MSRFIMFFQSKIIVAIIGTLVFGGAAALIAAAPSSNASGQSATTQGQASANTATQGATSTAPTSSPTHTPSAGSHTPTPGTSPTAGSNTPTPGTSPTATPASPRPSPTPTTPTTTTLRGTVASVNTGANLFTVTLVGGGTATVTVTAQTTFQGACTSLSGLGSGWSVSAHGTYQQDGSFAASSVFSDN